VTASEEQAGPAAGRDSLDRARADRERGRRPAEEPPAPDLGENETADLDADGEFASEHEKLTVANDPLDKPAESDATP
jgi:hypothetical protein